MMELKPIVFKIKNRRYNFVFNSYNIIQIAGDTSIGKSLFFSDFLEYQKINNKNNVLFINIMSKNFISALNNSEWLKDFDTIVIDNIDILMTEALERVILDNPDKYWVLIGRKMFDCVPFCCYGVLKNKNNYFYLDYSKKW